MKCRFSRVTLAAILFTGLSAGAAAQATRPQDPPREPAPVEAPAAQPPVERPDVPAPSRRLQRPVIRVMQDYTLAAGEEVPEIRVIFGDATIEGVVSGDVLVVLGSARLVGPAQIGGSLVVVGGGVNADADARVRRELVVVGGTLTAPRTFSAEGDQVIVGSPMLGEAIRDISPWVTRGLVFGRLIVPGLDWVWTVVIVFFLVYLALNTIFDRGVGATADVIVNRPMSAFMAGLLVLVLAVPVLAIVAATVIGLAVIPFLVCALVVAALLGKTAVVRGIGRSVLRTETPEGRGAAFLAFLIGFAILTLAYMVPVLGIVTWALTSVLGLGAATVTARGHLRRERKVAAPPPPPPPAPRVVARPEPAVAAAVPPDAHTVDAAPDVAPPTVDEVPPIPPPPPPPSAYTHGLAQYPRATFLDRLAAFVLDFILVAVASAMLDLRGTDEGWFWFMLLAYHIGFWAWKGTTLGGIICNLKVTRTDGTDLQFQDALVRGLSGIFSFAALGIGFFWMLQDPENQTWHDKIAGTLVVKVPRHVVLP
jgi:uncharacterized RDD family membrane protein YckC